MNARKYVITRRPKADVVISSLVPQYVGDCHGLKPSQ